MMRARFPLLLLLGIVFLASVSASFASEHGEQKKCLKTCEKEDNPYRKQLCEVSCSLIHERGDDDEERGEQPRPQPQPRPRPHPRSEEDEEDEREQPSPRPRHHREKEDQEREEDEREEKQKHSHKPHQKEQQREDEDEDDEDEREQQHQHKHHPREREHKSEDEDEDEEKHRRQLRKQESEDEEQQDEDEEQQDEDEDDSESWSPKRRSNPFHFSSNHFRTLFKNQQGQIRLLQRFDKRSQQLQNLQDYRILEFWSKPRTLLLPHHDDSEFLLFVLSGKTIITFVKPDDRDSYNLESGDAIRIPAGTTFYLVNPQENNNLRIIKLALPVNNPRRIQSFFLSSTEEQQSYLEGFSKDILEASFDTGYEEINKVLFGEENRSQRKQELEGVIVEISKEQIGELKRNAKSSSRKTISSEHKPFNLRSSPLYSNNFGELFEITPEKNPQLKDLDIFLNYLKLEEGGLYLPHFHSKATLILAVNRGEAEIELVGLRQNQQEKQEEQEGPREVRRYKAELSEDDIFTVPAGYPFAINATSNLRLLAFGINAENNQRYFLAGEKDNVLRQIHRPVKDLAFPGSAEDIEKLIKNQRKSYFVDAQPQQEQEERRGKKGPLSSILGALY